MLKDDLLARLALEHNVAQFVSVDPRGSGRVRHWVVAGSRPTHDDVDSAIEQLIARSRSGLVNVRTFDPAGHRKSTAFQMGLSSLESVRHVLSEAADQGLLCIVNESIDVKDGGVSGVAMPDVVEFAPDAGPRVVDDAAGAVFSASPKLAASVLRVVYGVDISNLAGTDRRIEFSVHPKRSGVRMEHVTVWESGPARVDSRATTPITWPNAFSRHLGDKAFGLLIGELLGVRVPRTTVLARRVPPFSFGTPTKTGDTWLRTAPRVPQPGRFPTVSTWEDPFAMMERADPRGQELASVLVQDAVNANWSGSTANGRERELLIQGVEGSGDDFMLGRRGPDDLPAHVSADVAALVRGLEEDLGPVRVEWAHDGDVAWLLQLHLDAPGRRVASVGVADRWIDFDPSMGLERLREVVAEALEIAAGVNVTQPVGMTSHIGEIIRGAGVPARFGGPEGLA